MSTLNMDYAERLERSRWLGKVSVKAATLALRLEEAGAIRRLEARTVADGQVRIEASVKHPSLKKVWRVLVFLSRQPGGQVMVAPSCSCPVQGLCGHAVAVVSAFIQGARTGADLRPGGPAIAERNPVRKVRGRERLQRKRKPPVTRRYLAALIVPVEEAENGGVALEILHSTRPVIDGFDHVRCSREDLFHPGLADELGKSWMRNLLEQLRDLAGDKTAPNERVWSGPKEVLRFQPEPAVWKSLIEAFSKWQSLYWGGGPNPLMLHRGEARPGKPVWEFHREGEVFLTNWQLDEPADAIIPSAPLYYIEVRRRLLGPVTSPFADAVALRWVRGDRQPSAKEVRDWNAETRKNALGSRAARFPLPPRREVIDGREIPPTPCLRFGREELPRSTMRGFWSPVYQPRPVGALFFDYEGHQVPESGCGYSVRDERVRVLRHEAAEREAGALLDQLGLVAFAETLPEGQVTDDLANLRWIGAWEAGASEASWMVFMTEHVPRLEKAGWRIEWEPGFDMRFVRPDRWVQELREKRNRSWFEFELGVDCEGERIDLIPVLIAYLKDHADVERRLETLGSDEKIPVRLEDGRFLAFPVSRLQPIVRVLKDILEGRRARGEAAKGEGAELHQLVAADFLKESREFTDAGPSTSSLQLIGHRLRSFEGIAEGELPQGLRAELRAYQEEGYHWLQFLAKYGLGGILADDMGLGKTLQTIAHLLSEKEKGALTTPALVVTPTSLLGNWQDELEKFAPSLSVHLHYGPDRHAARQAFDAADVIITSYSLVYRDQSFLEKRCFSHLILDEAQNIKNPSSRSAQAVCSLDAIHRLCLSGTPMENHLEELWSLFHFLMPGFLGRLESFRSRFRYPIERDQDEAMRDLLARRVGPLMLRRKKTEVARELPPKTEMVRTVELEGAQRDLYETIRASMQERVHEVIAEQGLERAHIYILEALLKLRQVCCHPQLLNFEAAQAVAESAKMELLFELLPEMIAEGRRVLLFSQFTSMLALIEKRLADENMTYVKLTGSTRDRASVVRRFQEGEVPLFLISLKAGGVGLNLTRADTVIHYDPWWNPAVESQATDRAYRIGQEQPVFVYKLITKGSIEERIVALQEDKKELVESLLSAGAKRAVKLDKADLEQLLRPLS